jgi:hypothetical protein
MKKTKICQYEYILNEDEAELIIKCLLYCRHRLIKHKQSGLSNVIEVDRVIELLTNFFK